MVDAVEFYPVEVTKNFMSLTVGDILRMNPNTGRYELHIESEDIGETIYKYDKYEISFEPWVIQKYMDHFQIYESDIYQGQGVPGILKSVAEPIDNSAKDGMPNAVKLGDEVFQRYVPEKGLLEPDEVISEYVTSDEFKGISGDVVKDPEYINKGRQVDITSLIMDIEDIRAEIASVRNDIEEISNDEDKTFDLLDKWSDRIIDLEKSKEVTELPLTPDPDECYERNDSAFEELKEDLEVFRVEVERLNAMIEEIKNREDNTKSTSRKVTVKK